tara:strand:- start:548439 stop:550187 length:1749 start_codon:yes stop_codon:yes gene_type:complete
MVNMFTSTILNTFDKGRFVSSSILLMFLLILFSMSVSANQIDLTVDRNPIVLTDSFQLTFSTTESPDDDPNFDPLKQDFDIINQQKSSQLSWVNGATNKTIQWTLNVMAKRSGDLQIPAIFFGNDASQPLSITVIETTPLSAISDDDELFLEVEANPTKAYVQSQVLYTVRFYHRINLAQATLSDPELDNAVIEKIAEDSQYNTKIKGMTYRVTERKYAIFPQQSGAITIAPLVLTAEVVTADPRSRYNSLFSNQSTQTKRILSKAINLNVQAAPASFNNKHWLPAEQVALRETWSNNQLQVKVGEPITRTLTIFAKGATSSQLPDLSIQQSQSELKFYPDQAVMNDQRNADGILAVREQKMAFIPAKAGNFTLPAINLPWFNTQSQEIEYAQLPEVTLVAIASEATETIVQNPNTPKMPAVQQLAETTLPTSSAKGTNIWMWTSLGLGFTWLVTLVFIFWSRYSKPRPTLKAKIDITAIKPQDITKELKTACTRNQPQAAQQALIKWASINYNIINLAELSVHCGVDLQAELNKLNHALYAKEKVAWDGSGLLQAIMAKQTQKSPSENDREPLVPLYPSQR